MEIIKGTVAANKPKESKAVPAAAGSSASMLDEDAAVVPEPLELHVHVELFKYTSVNELI